MLPRLGVEPLATKNLLQKAWPKVAALTSARQYTDQVESGMLVEGRKQIEAQLAQDKKDFKDFLVQDGKEHHKVTFDEFRETLEENRIDSSDWQTMMLWLQTGVKRNPITS